MPVCLELSGTDGLRRIGQNAAMPSLIRLLIVLGVLAALVYGGMIALVTIVDPNPREMTVRIPADRLQPK